jgi:hypothetical protein
VLLSRKREIQTEIESLMINIKMLEAKGLPTDNCISQISKLLREYTDLCIIENEQNKVALCIK